MKKIEITEENLNAAYGMANDETKKVLDALFGRQEKAELKKPSLDDYTTIKSYEDACEALGEDPILIGIQQYDEYGKEVMPKHIQALMKLEVISRALWGRNWQPMPDAEGNKTFWWPWFALFTSVDDDSPGYGWFGALLSGYANDGTSAGFGSLHADYRSSFAIANIGFRLCQETEEKAKYFGKTFIKLWAEYLAFNFTVDDYYFTNNK